MPFDLRVEDFSLPVFRAIANPVTEIACKTYNLGRVDLDIVHTRLESLPPPLFEDNTHGLICYTTHPLSLSAPVRSSVAVRLDTIGDAGTRLQTLKRAGPDWQTHNLTVNVDGTLGCTAAVNLGFFLLNELQSYEGRQLGVLILLDRKAVRQLLVKNPPVRDEAVMELCRKKKPERLPVRADQGDCEYYLECEDQSGIHCDFLRAKCVDK
jgi:hypothetical protein